MPPNHSLSFFFHIFDALIFETALTAHMKTQKIFMSSRLEWALYVILGVLLVVLTVLSEATFADADDMMHYAYSRWAYDYPQFLFDHWAKPLYTLIASPFAQFGHIGVRIMNILFALLTARLAVLIAKKLHLNYYLLLILLVIFTPIYLMLSLSGNIEVLFAFMLMLSVYLMLYNKFYFSFIVLSFIFLVRTEGFILYPFFILFALIHKKYKSIPFILTGFLVYSAAGYFIHNDFLWLINKQPYTGAGDIYGHGNWYDYLSRVKSLFGIIPTAFIVLTIIILPFKKPFLLKNFKSTHFTFTLLIVLPFLTYFAAHSYVWWKGIAGSGGNPRVMAAISPLAALTAFYSIYHLLELLQKQKFGKYTVPVAGILLAYFIVSTPFIVYQIPYKLTNYESHIKETAEWIKENGYEDRKLFFSDPRLLRYIHQDPFGKNHIFLPRGENVHMQVKPGELVMWDAHFSHHEEATPVQKFQTKYFQTIFKSVPFQPATVYGKQFDTYVYLFERVQPQQEQLAKISHKDTITFLTRAEKEDMLAHMDFDTEPDYTGYLIKSYNQEALDSTRSKKGTFSYQFSPSVEYGPTLIFNDNLDTILENGTIKIITHVYSDTALPSGKAYMVCQFMKNGKTTEYLTREIQIPQEKTKEWIEARFKFEFDIKPKKVDEIKLFVHNTGKAVFLMDEVIVLK